jgi:AcrR family transcriptional regulator
MQDAGMQVPSSTGNRDKLLRGALECVQERGYGNTSSRDLARAAGANVASSNYRFGSKDAFLDEVLGTCFEMWSRRVEAAFAAVKAQACQVRTWPCPEHHRCSGHGHGSS